MTRFLVFIGIALTIIASIHYYLWVRLIRDPHLPSPWGGLATAALIVLAANMPLAMFVGRARPSFGRVLAWPAFVWMGVMFLLFVAVAGADIVKVAAWMVRRFGNVSAVDIERRT